MSSCRKVLLTLTLMAVAGLAGAQGSAKYPGVGRDATPKEVAAWDIDVRPDFKGLPAGSGTVAKGQDVWEAKCAQCHGIFGESNEVFNPLIGGTSADDIKTGRVAKLKDPEGGRTTFMKVATLSTVWDYINRAMPWTAPKSLTTDEVYSVTAFLLNLAGVVPDNFTLSNKNMGEVQARMPNRNGMQTRHDMWPGNEFGGTKKPDTANVACMKNCSTEPTVASFLPDFARDAHGNLLEQNRTVGPQRGADTSKPEGKAGTPGAATAAPMVVAQATTDAKTTGAKPDAAATDGKAALALANKNGCLVCHGLGNKIVGPALTDIAKKYPGKADYLAGKIKSGGSGLWGPIPMPPQTLSDADARTIAAWLASGAAK
ncbi:MAG: c-type cytochrome [Burkholderiaceae bacterium]|nr:c-type cytochrome [Burkholderiaceae bacterium]